MLYLFLWWFLLLLIGFAALPVTMRFLRFLPDRGYAFAKPLALLLWVYPFWLLTSLGFLQNNLGVLAFLLVAIAGASWGLLRGRGKNSVIAWLRENWRYVLIVEGVFAIAMLGFAYFRAFNPDISGTEKPMEFMFLNSILQSETFPPHDAWLSGFAISYYYLGYVIVAALAKLGNIPPAYAFNLGLTMTFALAAVGAFGLIFNVVRFAQTEFNEKGKKLSLAPYAFGILAVFLLLVIGNLEGAFESAYNAGIGSREFYADLNLHGLEEVTPSGTFQPEDNWWWWRASRVLNDKNPTDGGHVEVIDEFPMFSFLLGDLHPHVLALPYGLLALAIALNLLLRPVIPIELVDDETKQVLELENASFAASGFVTVLTSRVLTPGLVPTMLVVGALGMLNTWDIVTYGFVIAAAFALAQFRAYGKASWSMLLSSGAHLVALFVGGALLFLPFYVGFSSQARGIAPNIFNRTPLAQYLIMFGLFVFVIASFVVVLFAQQTDKRRALKESLSFAVPLLAVPPVIALLGMIVLASNEALRNTIAGALNVDAQNAAGSVLGAFVNTFVSSPGTFVLLVALIALIAALGRLHWLHVGQGDSSLRTAVVFALLLALVGLFLTFGVEFLYIRDVFESRMNTVFKLYYQAWLLLSMAAAFGAFYIWHTVRNAGRSVWFGAFGVLVALSLLYPLFAIPNRANNFESNAQYGIPTLDGWTWVRRINPDDYAAIEWLRANASRDAVILESVGRQYSFDNRVSVATGIPTVLGWGGHEGQWGRDPNVTGSRERDIETIYKSRDVNEVRSLLDKYDIRYVIVGSIERERYNLSQALQDKFSKLGELVFDQDSMRIYRVGAP